MPESDPPTHPPPTGPAGESVERPVSAARPWRRFAMGLVLVAALAVIFVFFVDVRVAAAILRRARLDLLLAAALVLLVGLAAYARRWQALILAPTPFFFTFLVSNLGHTLNLWLPLRPGDAARVAALGAGGRPGMPEVTSSIVVERWLEQIMRLIALGGAVAFGSGMAVGPWSLGGAAAVLLAALVFLLWMLAHRAEVLRRWPPALAKIPRLGEARARRVLSELLDGLAVLSSPARLARGFGWSLVTWALFWAANILTLLALAPDLALNDQLAISIAALALAPPSAPAQPGVYQGTVVVALGVTGYDENLLTAYSLLLQVLQLLWMTPFGLWALARVGLSWQALTQPRPEG